MKELTHKRAPLDWAATQTCLGSALKALGERENNTALLQEAVTVHKEALKEFTRERAPLDWAVTQNNLGFALLALGEREDNTALLQDAVTAHKKALKELFANTHRSIGRGPKPT